MTETDEAMEASMRGLELHVQGVNSGYADAPRPSPSRDPPPTQTCRKLRTATVNSAKDRKAISCNKSSNSEAVLTKCFLFCFFFCGGGGGSWRLQTGLG